MGLTTSPRGLHFSSGPQLHTPVLKCYIQYTALLRQNKFQTQNSRARQLNLEDDGNTQKIENQNI